MLSTFAYFIQREGRNTEVDTGTISWAGVVGMDVQSEPHAVYTPPGCRVLWSGIGGSQQSHNMKNHHQRRYYTNVAEKLYKS